MNMKTATALCMACGILLAACDGGSAGKSEVGQTRFPGQVSAGGGTSGEVMARATQQASAAGKNSGQEGVRGQAPAGSVSGTPSIPEGSGGTASGAEMGGTSPGAAASQVTPPPGAGTPSVPAQEGK